MPPGERSFARSALSRRILAVAVASACALVMFAINSALAAPQPGDLLPDLVADPVSDVILTTDAGGASDRLLLRFAGFINNDGDGAVEIRGSRPSTGAPMSVLQRLFGQGGGFHDDPSPARLAFEDADGHDHWHLMQAARYSLWNSARSAETAPAMKVGFCLEDSERVGSQGPRNAVYGGARDHHFCEQGRPGALSVFQGISGGWRDEYHNQLALQWVDVSSVQPGSYWLRSDVDPGDVVTESVEGNQAAWAGTTTTIPGYVAQAVDGGQVSEGSSAAITLAAQRIGSPGSAAYRIESAPANGTLDLATGASRTTPSVRYTPRAGFHGTDSFTYSARDSTSQFPRSPATATVTVRVGDGVAPVVQISGAPDTVIAGTSVQLSASVANDPPGVTWSVGGTPGGSAQDGTISAGGLYRAPAQPPSGGTVTIGARSSGGGYDERRVQIIPAPAPVPAPLPAPVSPGSGVASEQAAKARPRARLSAPRASRIGRRLILTTTPARSGLVRLSAYAGGRLLGSCSTRTPGGRQFACRLDLAPGMRVTAPVSVVASLRVQGRVVAVRRRAARPVPAGHAH